MKRVVITGLGILAPSAHGLPAFEEPAARRPSAVRFRPDLAALNFGCQVAGVPDDLDEPPDRYFDPAANSAWIATAVIGCIAGIDCWGDAGLPEPHPDHARLGHVDRLWHRHRRRSIPWARCSCP